MILFLYGGAAFSATRAVSRGAPAIGYEEPSMEPRWFTVVVGAAVGVVLLVLVSFWLRPSAEEESTAPRREPRADPPRPTVVVARHPRTDEERERRDSRKEPLRLERLERPELAPPPVELSALPERNAPLPTPVVEERPTPIQLKTVGAVEPDLLIAAQTWLAEAVHALNTADVDRIVELLGFPEETRAVFAKWIEERPDLQTEIRDAEIFSLGGGRVRLKFERTDNWFDPAAHQQRTETTRTDQVFVVREGQMRLEQIHAAP